MSNSSGHFSRLWTLSRSCTELFCMPFLACAGKQLMRLYAQVTAQSHGYLVELHA